MHRTERTATRRTTKRTQTHQRHTGHSTAANHYANLSQDDARKCENTTWSATGTMPPGHRSSKTLLADHPTHTTIVQNATCRPPNPRHDRPKRYLQTTQPTPQYFGALTKSDSPFLILEPPKPEPRTQSPSLNGAPISSARQPTDPPAPRLRNAPPTVSRVVGPDQKVYLGALNTSPGPPDRTRTPREPGSLPGVCPALRPPLFSYKPATAVLPRFFLPRFFR